MKVALICGGPSPERGISLNSARSVMDHLQSNEIEVAPFYFDLDKNVYQISKAQLYSNTPADFDFKLKNLAKPLSERKFILELKKTDIVFPAMHGVFGEDGGIQKFLEENQIPFVGSSAEVCAKIFDKYEANESLRSLGYFAPKSVVLEVFDNEKIENFFIINKIERAVVKPAKGGSSIGVYSVATAQEAADRVKRLLSGGTYDRVVIEPFAQGTEFTVIILENGAENPVAILPIEIEADYTKHQIYDFRKKYLPTRQVVYHCPPRFDEKVIRQIQKQAEDLFVAFGLRDFARFDGWLWPDGRLWFSDFNPISGMEQNSLLFIQTSRIGFSHADALNFVLKNACVRYNINFPDEEKMINENRRPVNIIFGGNTSERQVSVMSGTNVWLKLRQSKKYEPRPYILDLKNQVWRAPYYLLLNHTVEEISANCERIKNEGDRLENLEKEIRTKFGLPEKEFDQNHFKPQDMSLDDFIASSEFVFIGLHGGDGENGNFQKMLDKRGIKYNGPNEKTSRLCMNKSKTAEFIKNIAIEGICSIAGKVIETKKFFEFSDSDCDQFWKNLCQEFLADSIIVKPNSDGCSSGVVHLCSSGDLKIYIEVIKSGVHFIPKNTFKKQINRIEMPLDLIEELLFEKYIETDQIYIKKDKLKYNKKNGWVEITVGIIENKGEIIVFNPSVAVSEGDVLSVEEKFQGGTGINLTPPPPEIAKKATIERTRGLIRELAIKMGIKGYSRIDAFMNVDSGDLIIIEINTLPGLTPSTVFYQQALAEPKPIFPKRLLEILIENKGY